MALSKNVKENLEESQSYLRAALANAARSEKSNIAHGISELLVGIDRIIKMEEFSDKIEELTENMKKEGGNGSSFFWWSILKIKIGNKLWNLQFIPRMVVHIATKLNKFWIFPVLIMLFIT